jgi:cell division protein ZapE
VLLDDVPQMSGDQRNEARRFMMLVDALYEHRCNLLIAADAPPERLYTGQDGGFEFQRTVSRLMEMQSKDYIALPHLT